MSSDETQSALSRAYNLVEAGNYQEARAILEPILAANKNNADAWWIYAHAVTDPEAGRDALENVARIDPRYPGLTELLGQARERYPAKPKITSLVKPVSVPEAPLHLPEVTPEPASSGFRPLEPTRDTREQRPAPRRSIVPLVAVVVVIIVIVAAVLLLTQNNGGTPAVTATSAVVALPSETPLPIEAATTEAASPTEVEQTASAPTAVVTENVVTLEPTLVPTEAATAEIAATPVVTEPPTVQISPTQTEIPPTQPPTATEVVTEAPTQPPTAVPTEVTAQATAESAAENFAAIEQAMSSFSIAESGVGEVSTSLGNTLIVTVCTTPGRAMRTLLPQAMNALSKQSPILGTSVDAVGVRMLDCAANAPLVTIAVELATAQSYAKGDLTDSAYAATWKPQ